MLACICRVLRRHLILAGVLLVFSAYVSAQEVSLGVIASEPTSLDTKAITEIYRFARSPMKLGSSDIYVAKRGGEAIDLSIALEDFSVSAREALSIVVLMPDQSLRTRNSVLLGGVSLSYDQLTQYFYDARSSTNQYLFVIVLLDDGSASIPRLAFNESNIAILEVNKVLKSGARSEEVVHALDILRWSIGSQIVEGKGIIAPKKLLEHLTNYACACTDPPKNNSLNGFIARKDFRLDANLANAKTLLDRDGDVLQRITNTYLMISENDRLRRIAEEDRRKKEIESKRRQAEAEKRRAEERRAEERRKVAEAAKKKEEERVRKLSWKESIGAPPVQRQSSSETARSSAAADNQDPDFEGARSTLMQKRARRGSVRDASSKICGMTAEYKPDFEPIGSLIETARVTKNQKALSEFSIRSAEVINCLRDLMGEYPDHAKVISRLITTEERIIANVSGTHEKIIATAAKKDAKKAKKKNATSFSF